MDNLTFDAFNYATVKLSQIGKQIICELERGPSDNPPILIWQGQGDDDVYLLPLEEIEDRTTMLKQSFSKALNEFGMPRYIAVIAEAYLKKAKSIDEVKNIKHGELQERFLNEFDASIREVISITCFDLDGHISVNVAEYTYDDTGLPVFDEVKKTDIEEDYEGDQGVTISAIKEFIKSIKMA